MRVHLREIMTRVRTQIQQYDPAVKKYFVQKQMLAF